MDEWVSDITSKGTSLPTECVFYTYKDADGLLWYSNTDDDGDYFSDAVQILTMAKATQIANWQLKPFAKKMIHIWMCSQRAKMQ